MRCVDVPVVRAVDRAVEVRADGASGLGVLSGHFSVFNEWYVVSSLWEGDFLERVVPGAYAQTIAEDRDGMRVLFDHGFDPQLGNKVLGPITSLVEDERGAAYEVDLFDTTYNRDLLPGLRAGVYGASMRMRVLADAWDDEPVQSEHNPKGLPERSITRAQVMEFGPVTFPANPAATASARSATDHYYDQLARRDAATYEAVLRSAGLPPDFTGRPDTRGAGGGVSTTRHPAGTPVHRAKQDILWRTRKVITHG
jgi:HK97 family phage prohead protease